MNGRRTIYGMVRHLVSGNDLKEVVEGVFDLSEKSNLGFSFGDRNFEQLAIRALDGLIKHSHGFDWDATLMAILDMVQKVLGFVGGATISDPQGKKQLLHKVSGVTKDEQNYTLSLYKVEEAHFIKAEHQDSATLWFYRE